MLLHPQIEKIYVYTYQHIQGISDAVHVRDHVPGVISSKLQIDSAQTAQMHDLLGSLYMQYKFHWEEFLLG